MFASSKVFKPKCEMKVKRKIPNGSITDRSDLVSDWVVVYMLGPERWWTMRVQDEARGNSGGSPKQYWRANRLSEMRIGAKD